MQRSRRYRAVLTLAIVGLVGLGSTACEQDEGGGVVEENGGVLEEEEQE